MAEKNIEFTLWNVLAKGHSDILEGYSVADIKADDLVNVIANYDGSDVKKIAEQFDAEVTSETLRKSVG